ncbi:SAV_2336 N-terminal domain-related protein [Streptomyces sp. NPDC046716]|uniref:SAV_2336 N-terminal domain-related protein n=1 Tax=Streptomyces sp. NPDC046716 TaxID=3157093 RepID=UPI0033FDFF9B
MSAARASHDPGEPSRAGTLLTAFAGRLREAELDPGVEELADAMWLAGYLDPGTPGVAGLAAGPPAPSGPEPPPVAAPISLPDPSRQQPSAAPTGLDVAGRLFVPSGDDRQPHGLRAVPVRVPAPPVLPDPVGLQRGLRPLQRYRAPVRPAARLLDEQATAELAARSGGLVIPVLAPRRRREARLLLLMDLSTSTVVWREALDELRLVCERAGAFREVQVQYLHEDEDGCPGTAAAVGNAGRLRDPAQLTDPTGRQLIMVLSDCAGPMWRSGRMQRLLHRWARSAPVAVVQPLPQVMWERTHLPARRGVLHRREGPAGRLEFTPDRGRPVPDALPVPVLALRRSSVEGWAGLMAGSTGRALRTAAGWVGAAHPASSSPVRAHQEVPARDRVRTFLRRATPPARKLALSLSVVPLYLPVMRLVQHAMLAGSGPDVLAEVLLSGLLRRRGDADDPEEVRYEFLPDIAPELRRHVDPQEAELLLKHCSEYVARNFGRTARNFPALAAAYLRGTVPAPGPDASLEPLAQGREEPPGLRAFAEVSLEVLRDLAPRVPLPAGAGAGGDAPLGYTELVRRGLTAEKTYAREGNVRELERAVELYREAGRAAGTQDERSHAAESLGSALLRQAMAGAPPESLLEALEALRGAPSLSPRGLVALGRTLVQLAAAVDHRELSFDRLPLPLRDWAQAQATDETPAEEWAVAELLHQGAGELTALAEEDPEDGEFPVLLLAATRQLLAYYYRVTRPDGHFRAARPRDWFTGQLELGLAALEMLPDDTSAHRVRAELRLALAKFYDGRLLGDVTRDEDDHARALLNAGLAQAQFEIFLEKSTDPDAEACLGLAAALGILGEDPAAVVAALDEALAAAAEASPERFEALTRTAEFWDERYRDSGERDDIDRAVDAWERALQPLGPDDEKRAETLTHHGRALLERAMLPDTSAEDSHLAVQALREAVDATPGGHRLLPYRRIVLARACITRFQGQGVSSDLHEADWILAEAARESDDPAELVLIWFLRSVGTRLLADRTARRDLLHVALQHIETALETAAESGHDWLGDMHGARADLLSALDRPGEAVTAYRAALSLTADAGDRAHLEARIAELEAAPE